MYMGTAVEFKAESGWNIWQLLKEKYLRSFVILVGVSASLEMQSVGEPCDILLLLLNNS